MSSEMELSPDECARIYQMLENMSQQMNEMNSKLEALYSQPTIPIIVPAPTTASAPATAASTTAPDSVPTMIIEIESIVSAFVASASVSTVASASLATELVSTPANSPDGI